MELLELSSRACRTVSKKVELTWRGNAYSRQGVAIGYTTCYVMPIPGRRINFWRRITYLLKGVWGYMLLLFTHKLCAFTSLGVIV